MSSLTRGEGISHVATWWRNVSVTGPEYAWHGQKKHKEACKWGRCTGLRYVVRKGKGGTDCVEMGGTGGFKRLLFCCVEDKLYETRSENRD